MTSHLRPLILTALLGLALLVPASAGAATERTISVTANATLKVPNDSAGLGLAVSRERSTRGAALRAVAGGLRAVLAVAQGTPGVGAGDITTGRISVRKSFRGTHPTYRASAGISVTLHQPDKAGELVSTAIGAGATGVRGPNFFVGDSEAAFTSALAAAFDKAKVRAGALATQAGGTLGPALQIDEGEGPSITPEFDAKAISSPACGVATTSPSEAGTTAPTATAKRCTTAPPPVKPGTSTVTATVHVVFALQ